MAPNERTEQNPIKRTKRNSDNPPTRCRVQNTGDLVTRMLTEIASSHSIKEEMKATLSEIKKNPQGTSSEGKLGFNSTIWNIRRK